MTSKPKEVTIQIIREKHRKNKMATPNKKRAGTSGPGRTPYKETCVSLQ